ncbi:MAG: hypothetical protein SFV54_25975 [Bryobacteraceae bacterium]|nr:hypothetical protein [Bryobacteraceae bacterium]
MRLFAWLLWLCFLRAAAAQEPAPPKLVNEGKPLRVPVQCGAAQIESLGLDCSEDAPCPIFVELASAGTIGDRLFVSGNLHTASVTLSSVLLASDDGGKTWYEGHERIASAGLEHMQFLDLEHGWIAGQILGAIPKDPFFLVTTNGGKTFVRRDVYVESRPGAIDQFWFDSRTAGSLIVDRLRRGDSAGRYEVLETMTGGDNWSLRQIVMKPTPLKRRAAGGDGWRVRAHAPSKSYRVEKQEGTAWTPVAAFLVSAGECKP